MPKRRERVAPPPVARGWDMRYANSGAVKGWEQICATAPTNTRTAWERITSDPRRRDHRQHPLRGPLGRRSVNGTDMEQWQYEVTASGRIWYCIDDKTKTVWITDTHVGHPKVTE